MAKTGHKVEDFEVLFVETWDGSGVVKTIDRKVTVRMRSTGRAVLFDGKSWCAYIDSAIKAGDFR